MANGDSSSETRAISLIREALGGESSEWTGGDSSKSDGYIVLAGGREVQVEVTRDVPEQLMRAAAIAEKQGSEIALRPGAGSWVALLAPASKIQRFLQVGQELIDDFFVARRTLVENQALAFDYQFKDFHINAIQKIGTDKDHLLYATNEVSGRGSTFIDTSPNSIAAYAQDYIDRFSSAASKSGGSSKLEHLVKRATALNRIAHLALIAESPMDTGVRFALYGLGAKWDFEVPNLPLTMPDGLDAFWVIRGDYQYAATFFHDTGWAVFSNA